MKIDLSDKKQFIGYSHYLVMRGQLAGNMRLDNHKPKKEEVEIAEMYRSFCEDIVKGISKIPLADIPDVLECYDLLYRFGYKKLPEGDFISENKRRVFNAWKHKSAKIDESALIRMLISYVKFLPQNAPAEYVSTYKTIIKNWVDTLVKFDDFPGVTTHEKYMRLAILLREGLHEYPNLNQDQLKHKWYEKFKVDDYSSIGTYILRAYRSFVNTLFPAIMEYDEVMKLDNVIAKELTTRNDLDVNDKRAFKLALDFNNTYK